MRGIVLTAGVLLAATVLGCTPRTGYTPDRAMIDMAVDARADVEKLPDSAEKEMALRRLDALKRVLVGDQTPETSQVISSIRWYDMFGPEACEVSSLTRLADFDSDGANDGLVVRVMLKDRFGDPIKALGAFRIEAFAVRVHSTEPRGAQLANWYVGVLDERDVRRYYDGTDRRFRFPLRFATPPGTNRLVVQATYYLPDGTGRKLFGERIVEAE